MRLEDDVLCAAEVERLALAGREVRVVFALQQGRFHCRIGEQLPNMFGNIIRNPDGAQFASPEEIIGKI